MNVYGCHNRNSNFGPIVAQSGWAEVQDGFGNPCRSPVYVRIEHVMSTDCRYDLSATDSQCDGCRHRASGEVRKGCEG